MDRAKLDELRTRASDDEMVWRMAIGPDSPQPRDGIPMTRGERDALFAYIDDLERENRKMLEALEQA
jgi:hypothetical protein